MPMPSVDPMPLRPTLSRLTVPDDAHDASYFAASARISSFCRMSIWGICSTYVRTARYSTQLSLNLRRLRELANKADQPGLAATLQAFGLEDRADPLEAIGGVVIDQHIVIAVPMADLARGPRHARLDHRVTVGCARAQAALQLFHR